MKGCDFMATSSTTFTMNELSAIHCALIAQVEECEEFLSEPELPMEHRVQLTTIIKHSKSALSRLDIIFKENGFNPEKN